MNYPNPRFQPMTCLCTDSPPLPDLAPPCPEILYLNGRHLVWRSLQRPSPGETPRPITWDIRYSGDETTGDTMTIHADLDRQGVMRAVDFREVRGRLNEVLMSEPCAVFDLNVHRVRLRQSLHWQRNLVAGDPHILPPTYDEKHGWRFSTSKGCRDPVLSYPLHLPVLRSATNRMMLERREERLWAAYRAELKRWTHNLALEEILAVHLPTHGPVCGMRMVHYWRWPLLLKLCRTRRPGHRLLREAEQEIDFFGSEPLIGPYILASYRRARSFEDIEKINGTGDWLHRYWQGLFQPGVGDAIGGTTPPLPETETIQHLNRPQELLQLSAIHNLCLENFTDPIIRGEYALYRIVHNGEFAVAGIKRGDDDGWEIDDIRGESNAEPPEKSREHFLQWLARETTHQSSRNAVTP